MIDGFSSIVAVMYHYVPETGRRLPGPTPDELRRQVERLLSSCEAVSPEQLTAFFEAPPSPPPRAHGRRGVVFTFDDGLKEHRTIVAPLLKEYGVQGHFLVSPRVLEAPVVLPVHRRHLLVSHLGERRFRDEFLAELATRGRSVDLDALAPFDVARRHHRWGTDADRQFKYLLNYVLDQGELEGTVQSLFHHHFPDESEVAGELYLSRQDVVELAMDFGHEVGGHGYSHAVLGRMSVDDQQGEIQRCREVLDSILPPGPRTFSYPFGKRDSAYTNDTMDLLRRSGFYCGFSTEVGMNRRGEDLDPYEIRRIDTNDVASYLNEWGA